MNTARRPIATRSSKAAKAFAAGLSKRNITPNQISLLSIVFALLAGISLIYPLGTNAWVGFVLGAVCIQGRLLCNLLDGMVAIEGGKKTPSGELFNDIPDRFADLFIIVPIGFAIQFGALGQSLGWLAGTLAVMTAYIRTLNSSLGVPVDFRGPMAKQHRMALLTVAFLLSAVESLYGSHRYVLKASLIILLIGSIITVYRRMRYGYDYLESKHDV